MNFKDILKDIKNIKIQGAENIAKHAVISLKTIKAKTKEEYLSKLKKAKELLLRTRPTEPLMRNCLNYVLDDFSGKTKQAINQELRYRIKIVIEHITEAEKIIAEIGSKKIRNGMIVFTHCHSSTVMNILKKAKEQGKKFSVNNTETRPLFQGRKTAKELLSYGIPVTHYVDSAARLALKEADIMLIGFDAIDSNLKLYNKIGSELFAEAANKIGVPVYACGDSWKYSNKPYEKIEERKPQEIWANAPKKLKIKNYAFEKINPELITGIISELGIYKPGIFIHELKRIYPFI